MDRLSTAKRKGRSLGVQARCSKRPSQTTPANPAWYTVTPKGPSTPIIAASGFKVSPGVNVGKVGSVRQAISAGNVVGDAAKALADIVGAGATMSPEEKEDGVHKVATALGMASVLLEKSAGVGTARSKGMVGIGGAFTHRRAIEAAAADGRRKKRMADPHGGTLGNAMRTPMADITAVVGNPSVVGLQLVDPKTRKSHAGKVRALPCTTLLYWPTARNRRPPPPATARAPARPHARTPARAARHRPNFELNSNGNSNAMFPHPWWLCPSSRWRCTPGTMKACPNAHAHPAAAAAAAAARCVPAAHPPVAGNTSRILN